MGLIKAITGSVGGVLAEQWKEYFYCDSLDQDTLVTKGRKRTSSRSSNTKGEDNIISNGSVIAVNDGQCMIIVEQGKVVEVCAEPGEFTYDSSAEPSVFSGKLGESILATFKEIGKRFTYGGDTGMDQRVYYFNTKEIPNNKFGTANPVPFKVVINEQLGYKLSVDLRFNGTYSYRIVDPILFYTNVCGNVSSAYDRSEIDATLKAELIMSLQPALAVLSANGISYDQIPAHNREIRDSLNAELVNDWGKRGIEVYSMNFGVPSIPEEQRKKITEWEETSMTLNANTAAARLVGGQVDAMKTAAANEAGAMTGFMGMGMAMNAGGANAANLYQMGAQQQAQAQQAQPVQPAQPAQAADSWTCPSCGKTVSGNFCTECGAKKPAAAASWTCSCGSGNTGIFCPQCGAKKPAAAPSYKCSQCGWTPADPKNPPKFCPQCGHQFGSGDIV